MTTKPPLSAEAVAADQPNIQIWRLKGKMMGSTCCYDFLEAVRDNIENGQIQAILDMSDVRFANSTGVGVLASIFTAAKDADGVMHLVGVNERVQSVLKVINLWYVVSTHETMDGALASIAEG
jgi:anti-sigma B factor antagonist